jgi:anti-anti-sigma factor
MGQLRSALTGYLLAGHPPATALEYLDRFAAQVSGATASSACCLVLDHATGELCWASAGHPPPLLLDTSGTRYLDGTTGTLLSVGRPGSFTEGRIQLHPGASVLLYTDGLVERRGELIDDGLARLADTACGLRALSPDPLAEELIHRMLDATGPADDVALVAVRLIPAPLHQRLPARLEELTAIRRTVRTWADAAGLTDDLVNDLQLALGEAAANAIEHAYPPDAPGEFIVELARQDTGAIQVAVQDFGAWRDEPPDNHHRGRGLRLINSLTTDVKLFPSATGTEIHFRIPPLPPSDQVVRTPRAERTPAPASLRITAENDGHQVQLTIQGDLDLAGVTTARAELFSHLRAACPIVVDLRPTSYLASAGVGLLTELADAARQAGLDLRIRTDPGSVAHRILTLTGLDQVLPVTRAEH